MILKPFLLICVLIPLAQSLLAQDGAQLYGLYCSACHGEDGKGATGGAFPPLAGSDWIEGNPERSIAIVLKGLNGPVEVSGKTYNLEMPPQGEVLGDDQISAILNYVNTSWGNSGGKVSAAMVQAARVKFAKRTEHWSAPELLKLFPLEKKETALKNLISRVYKGQWSELPDFSKLSAENVEEEHDGILDVKDSGMKDNFGMVWEGEFVAPEDGKYTFALDADDGARLLVHGRVICEVKGIGAMDGKRASRAKPKLSKGTHPIRIEYFTGKGTQALSLKWVLSGKKNWQWLSKPDTAQVRWPSIPLAPNDGRTAIYRNFIEGTTPRAIGFGFPGGLNLAYSADHLAPELLWAGKFIDAGRHWTNRGQGNQPPSAEKVITLTRERYLPAEASFKSYALDAMGNPTFNIGIGDQLFSDSWKPGTIGTLIRTLSLSGGEPVKIPLGNAEVTGAEEVTVVPGKPTTVTYRLK